MNQARENAPTWENGWRINEASANDATPKQILAVATCYQKMEEAILFGLEHQLDKEDLKRLINEAIESAAAFFGLGNQKAVKRRAKA